MATEIAAGRPQRQPTHPGKVLREIVVPELEKRSISISAFADHLGVSRNTVHAVLREARPVTPDVAARDRPHPAGARELDVQLPVHLPELPVRIKIGGCLRLGMGPRWWLSLP